MGDDCVRAELIRDCEREEGNGLGQRAVLVDGAHRLDYDVALSVNGLRRGLVHVGRLVVQRGVGHRCGHLYY